MNAKIKLLSSPNSTQTKLNPLSQTPSLAFE